MKAATYTSACLAPDQTNTLTYSCEITTSDTPQEAFKRTLAKGYAASVALDISSDIIVLDTVYKFVKTLHVRGMLIAGVIDKMVYRGDMYNEGAKIDVYINTPTRLIVLFEGDELYSETFGSRECIGAGVTIDDVYDLTKHDMPDGWSLPKVEYEDITYDSRDQYRKMTYDQLHRIIYENQMTINQIDWGSESQSIWSSRLAELIETDPVFVDKALMCLQANSRCHSVLDEYKQAMFDSLFG